MSHRQRVVSITGVVAVLMLAWPSTAAAQAEPPTISGTPVFAAPLGGKGGIQNPVASCPDSRVEPRTRWTLENLETGFVRSYEWRGSFPGQYFPRVKVGSYASTTKAWCQGVRADRTEVVEVGEKTRDTTVSWTEFGRIETGMTPREVRKIVGYGGRDSWTYGGETTRVYDNMAFWAWSLVIYRDGQVVEKHWQVGHD